MQSPPPAAASMPSPVSQPLGSPTLKSRKKRSPYVAIACGERPCKRCRDSDIMCVYGRATRFQSTDETSKSTKSKRDSQPTNDPHKPRERDAFRVKKPPPSAPPRTQSNAETTAQTRHGASDYYLRLAEKRLGDLSPGPGRSLFGSGRQQQLMIGSHIMQQLIDHRKTGAPPGTFAPLDKELWIRIIDIYEEEVALQYPFLDLENLRHRIRAAAPPSESNSVPQDQVAVEDIMSLVLSVASSIVDPGTLTVANSFVESLFSGALLRTQLGAVNKTDLSIIILASIFFFLNDKEMLAWRAIGNVLRSLHEIIAQNTEDAPNPTTLDQLKDVGEKFYWSVYTLDRRWGFGTGLPFSVHDSDIHRQPHFKDDSLSSTYLRQMIEYSIISAEVRRSILQPSTSPTATVTALAATRNLLDFQVTQFQKNIPKRLQFLGLQDKFDPTREKRGEYRLRLVLYLRCNQMRIVIHRKSAMSLVGGGFDTSTTNVLAETSQDTIRVLIALARETDIYHAQQRTFNHFLETALASLLLLLCYAEAEYRVGYLPDVLAAMELVQHLSVHSPVTRALKQKLHRVQHMIKAFRVSNHTSAQPSRSGSAVPDQFADRTAEIAVGTPTGGAVPPQMPVSLAPVLDAQQQPVFPPAAALAEMAMGGGGGGGGDGPFTPVGGGGVQPQQQASFQISQMNTPQPYDDGGFVGGGGAGSMHSQQSASDSTSMMDLVAAHDMGDLPNDFFTSQFTDLGDILKDYDNFRF
ncbi:fungal specific transcription factor domain-containing protein [Cordyceps fumosorosea ARSEF 2679]|uniref:Fungal specific transcription factor domain-containing protein n=1 Tax=Cordyceps fumosorosea (strain ARSEF 2679) TaxID=1081104 RepID=A0A168E2F4_CORFA|nr:fungal specific transcription factor domain-containing protein [Cordyceps fumosorosea ARSEF 2679]OAA73297.1 fungal specific transcription factor domain-containing protein [Cordyceps fumosorosea ARSEF 2679]